MKQKLTYFIIVIIIILIAAGLWIYLKSPQIEVQSFDECVKAGYPVMESYPRQCKAPNGQTFVEDIGNELEKKDLIKLNNPRSNQTIASPLVIEGEARGSWYFEGTFPVKIFDGGDNLLGSANVQAQGEWTTENFVPFRVELKFSTSTTNKGTLVLEKNNPSGLSENADQLKIPVNFVKTTVQEPSQPKEGFCGTSTYGKCQKDSDCISGGCSSQVCQSRSEESIITTCEWRECYNAKTYNLECKCLNQKCQWD